MSAPGLPEAFWSGKALFYHVQWLRETVFPVPFVLHVSPALTHVAFRLQWVKWPLQTFLLPPANHPGLSLADFDLGLKTGKIPPSIRASQTIAELSRRDSEELQIHEMFENTQFDLRVLLYARSHLLLHCPWNSEITPLLLSLQLCLE